MNLNNQLKFNFNSIKLQDKLFRDLLLNKSDVCIFLNYFLTNLKIVLNSKNLEIYNSSFINEQFQSREADVVYKVINSNTFILLEHQSYMDFSMPYRMLDYGTQIIKSNIDFKQMKHSSYVFPNVFLIVLYTGKLKWNSKLEYKRTSDKLLNCKTNGINAIYSLINIHDYDKTILSNSKSMIAKVMSIIKCKTDDELISTLRYLISNTVSNESKKILWKIIKILLSDILGTDVISDLLKNFGREDLNMFEELVADIKKDREIKLKRAKRRAEKRGERRGKKSAKIELIKSMLNEGIPIETICKVTNFSKNEIEKTLFSCEKIS